MLPKIKYAALSDAAGIAEVQVKSWQTAYRGIVPDAYLTNLSITTMTKEWQGYIRNGAEVLIADIDNSVAGYVAFCAPRMTTVDTQFAIELSSMYIIPDKWRQGIAKMLLNCALNEFGKRDIKKILLWVLEKNTLGRSFYRNMGFVETDNIVSDDWSGIFLNEILCKKQLISGTAI